MKRCPTCNKEFEDNMRFCQVDGTPLEEAAEAIDPYKTMVASKEDIAAAIPKAPAKPPEARQEENEVLEIPEAKVDPKKTMYASEAEIRNAMAEAAEPDEPVMDIPEQAEPAAPEPPKFEQPKVSPPDFGSSPAQPPPSPFAKADQPNVSEFSKTTPPIMSPFDKPEGSPGGKVEQTPAKAPTPEPPAFAPPEPAAPAFSDIDGPSQPFSNSPVQAEWTPPAVQESNFQEQNMQNPQFSQGGAAAPGGPSQTLAIISLVVGILSLFCCAWFVPGLAAVIMGFLARSKANSDPANYTGAGLALGGIITGAISMVLGVIVIILYVFMGVGASLMQNMR